MLEKMVPALAEAIAKRRMLDGKHNILIIDEELVAKRFFNSIFTNSASQAEREYKIGSELYDQGISVPRMQGIIIPKQLKPYLDLEERIPKPAESEQGNFRTAWRDSYLVMQRIYGEPFYTLENGDRIEACEQFRRELRKVLEMGYCPIDCDKPDNVLFDKNKKRLYLIDFEYWRRMDPRSVEAHHFLCLTEADNPFCYEMLYEEACMAAKKPNP